MDSRTSKSFEFCAGIVVALGAMAAGSTGVRSQDVSDFYQGNTIIFVVGSPAGGGYDIYARLLARHLPRYLAGAPNVVVRNQPGAGSVIATNHVYNVATQDGSVILAPTRTAAFAQILGQPGPKYVATKLNWLGSLNNEVGVMAVWHTAPVKTIEDARTTRAIFGSASPGGDGDIYPALLNNTIGTKFKVVQGYAGSSGVDLAMARGEVQGQSSSFSAMAKHFPDWPQKVNVLVQLSLTKHPELPNVPLIFDYIKPQFLTPGMTLEEADSLWRIMLIQKAMGRPFAVGPGVPAVRVKALRNAFAAVVKDATFLDEADKTQNEIIPVSGEEIQAMLEKISLVPASDIARLNEAITYKD